MHGMLLHWAWGVGRASSEEKGQQRAQTKAETLEYAVRKDYLERLAVTRELQRQKLLDRKAERKQVTISSVSLSSHSVFMCLWWWACLLAH
jgi:hypothetical protein